MIPSCCFDTTVQTQAAILPAGDGQTYIVMSKVCTNRSCATFALETKKSSPTSMSCSQCRDYENMKSLATITQALSIKVDSRVIRNVGSVGRGFMAMMSSMPTAGTSMKGAISVIEGIKADSNSILWTITP